MSAADAPPAPRGGWPALRVEDWTDTRETLHMWTQIVGKLRLAKAPMVNHWWQTALYVTPRGLTTSVIPDGERSFEVELDFCAHRLRIHLEGGEQRMLALEPKTVAQFYAETMTAVRELGIDVSIHPVPVEVEVAIPFEEDERHRSYDPHAANLFWRQLVQGHGVLSAFRSRFIGKVSPVHFFWGAMDLAVTRFSGRTAPRHPGGAPNVGDWVMVEGYSHELSSAGFWPGGDGEGMFYAYAYPEPAGFKEHPVRPAEAFYHEDGGQFVLPYEAVRCAPDPDAALLDFLQDTYEAAAQHGRWDREALEDDPARRAAPRRKAVVALLRDVRLEAAVLLLSTITSVGSRETRSSRCRARASFATAARTLALVGRSASTVITHPAGCA